MRSIFIFLVIFLLFLVGTLLVFRVFFLDLDSPVSTTNEEVSEAESSAAVQALYENDKADQTNNFFNTAETLLEQQGSSQHSSVRALYEKALANTSSFAEEAHIKYKIALTYNDIPSESVRLMKEIVATEEYPVQQKAYAVQHMYSLWSFEWPNFDGTQEEFAAFIFEGNPYNSFFDPNDLDLSFRKLNEFAVSLRSAPFSSVSIAKWYAENISKVSPEDQITFKSYIESIDSNIADAEDYILRNQDFALNASLEPRIRHAIAHTYSEAAITGIDKYVSDFPSKFKDAIGHYDGQLLQVSLGIRYAWTADAVFDKDGGKSWELAQPHLAYSVANLQKYPGLISWLKIRKDSGHVYESRIESLAERSPEFANLLTEIGY